MKQENKDGDLIYDECGPYIFSDIQQALQSTRGEGYYPAVSNASTSTETWSPYSEEVP